MSFVSVGFLARAARGFRLLCRKPNIEVWTGADLTAKGPYLYMKQLLEPSPKCDIRGSGGFKQVWFKKL